jgi:uncharacterized membrane protein YphA (DoxX/SURF4 family)
MHRRAFTKTILIGNEISPWVMILSIWLLATEKTRRQDGREVAWPWGGGVRVSGAQKSRLRRVGEVCCANFGVGSFSLDFSAGFGGRGVPLDVFWLFVVHGYTKIMNEQRPGVLSQGNAIFLDWISRPKTGQNGSEWQVRSAV